MDAATTSSPTPPPGSTGTVDASPHRKRDNPPKSPDKLPVGVVAQRRILKAGVLGSPVRRSPRLSSLPPPQPLLESQSTQDLLDASSDDDSESIDDVALHLSREETPENDAILPDEPSSMLASRILRAHDNPSPPPQDPAHPGINYTPGKVSQFPLLGLSVPPSPFRPINILEGLNQFSDPMFGPSRPVQTPPADHPPEISDSRTTPKGSFTSPEYRSPVVTNVSTECASHVKLVLAELIPSSSPQRAVDDIPSQSSQHLITGASSVGISITPPTLAVDPSSTPFVPPVSYNHPSDHLPSDTQSRPSPLPLATETEIPGGQDIDRKESSSTDDSGPSVSQGQQDGKYTNTVSHERLNSLSPHSNDVLAALCLPSDVTSSIKQTTLPSDISAQRSPSTPRSSVQRLVITPTLVRANNGARKMISPSKLLFEANDICRTPAQRVPIATALACGTPSSQRTIQLSTGLDRSQQLGRFPVKTPVFTRPALDGPSRSPAKRILVTDSSTSPARGHRIHISPVRIGHRARSTSVEPRPLRPILSRSRSVEPGATALKPDNHGKLKESIFPVVPIPPKSIAKLPFPLDPGQKSASDRPPSIPEEHESGGDTEADPTCGRVTQGNTISQLKQASTSSRIPRMGKKPYARPPPRNVKPAAGATSTHTAPSRVAPFQLTRKHNESGSGNTEGPSTQAMNDQRVVGSLKRKRGTEAAASSNSHPVMVRQVVPGILGEKYAAKPTKTLFQAQAPSEPSPSKAPQPLKFRKVVDGMLSARYAQTKPDRTQTEPSNSTSLSPTPDSPLSELSSSSDEGLLLPSASRPPVHPAKPHTHSRSSSHQDLDQDQPSSRLRRTSRARKQAQQQYVLDVFNVTTSTRPPSTRRKLSARTEGDGFMGMSATALKALTTSNTAKNQQTVVVLATEVIRKDGPRPESPMVKARTILQKQRDERDRRRRERAEKRTRMSEDGLGTSETEGEHVLGDQTDHDENDYVTSQQPSQDLRDDEDYETPEQPERTIEPLRLEGVNTIAKPVKQVMWHRGLSTAIYLDEVNLRPKSLSKDIVVGRGCLAPKSKNLLLDSLGNLVDVDDRPCPELVTEHIIVKKFVYDNDIEPESIPPKVTRSRSKKGRS
ncbi:hypothetical protein JVU11DRAFT_554 [Chiua virens]|nr:hypothetical protein JVU11DRAFT_554 [Chiua virens]